MNIASSASTATILELLTDRLLLRSFRPDDAAEFAALH